MLRQKIYVPIILCSVLLAGCLSQPLNYNNLPTPPSAQEAILNKSVDVAVVLSAGGSKALAHLGALEVLQEHNIPIDLIVGASAGSLMGAMYADNPNVPELKNKLLNLKKDDILDFHYTSSVQMLWRIQGLVHGYHLNRFVNKNIESKQFSELKIPLVAVATDIEQGQPYVIDSGQLAPAIHASSAIPLVFTPVKLYKRHLVDGGVISPVPVKTAKRYNPKLIIAIDVGAPPEQGEIYSNYALFYRSMHISYYALSNWESTQADILIRPNTSGIGMFDDNMNSELYKKGKIAAINALPHIHKAMAKANIPLTNASQDKSFN